VGKLSAGWQCNEKHATSAGKGKPVCFSSGSFTNGCHDSIVNRPPEFLFSRSQDFREYGLILFFGNFNEYNLGWIGRTS